MPLRMTRRAVFQKLAGNGIAAVSAGLALAGCDSKPEQQSKPNPADSNAGGEGGKDMRKYVCGKCGYVHDPAAFDPPKSFADLPADWKCPKCGSPKSRYAPKA